MKNSSKDNLPLHLVLVRAINVGGHQVVGMADLCQMVGDLGFAEARSILQTGNLLFRTNSATDAALESLLESATAKQFGFQTDFFVRTANEWKELITRNPFPAAAKNDPAHLLVIFLKHAPDKQQMAALKAAIVGRETVRAVGKQLYAIYPDGVGRSKLTIALIEKKLGTRGTGRNWNTVLKMGALVEAGR